MLPCDAARSAASFARVHVFVFQRRIGLRQQGIDVAAFFLRAIAQTLHRVVVKLFAHAVRRAAEIGVIFFGVFQQQVGGGDVVRLGGFLDAVGHVFMRETLLVAAGNDFARFAQGAVQQIPDAPVVAGFYCQLQRLAGIHAGCVLEFLRPFLVSLVGLGDLDLVLEAFKIHVG